MKILIAIDGSRFGTAAIEFTARVIDQGTETDVKIITVIEPAAGTELETIIESTEELLDPKNPEQQRSAQTLRDSEDLLTERCRDKKVNTSTEVLAGSAARTIVEEAEEWHADLIVIGSHGRGFWKRALLGSVSDRVADHAHCAVLIVRER